MGDAPMQEDDIKDPLNLRVLRALVTVLTVVMIVGLITVVVTFVTRFPDGNELILPDEIVLPEGQTARALTYGTDWYAVVTESDQILIFGRQGGELRQTITVSPE